MKNTRWIVTAIAAALWAAPTLAQTGATSDSARAGTAASSAAPEKNAPQGVPGGTGSTDAAKGASGGSVTAPSDTGSASGSTGSMSPGATASTTRGSDADKAETLQKLHAGNQAEIEAGKLMQQHAHDAKVKDFAKKMVKDHTQMDKDLQGYAQKHDVSLTGGTASAETTKDQEHMKDMRSMPSGQAQREYMSMMVSDHERDVSEVRSAAEQAKSAGDKDLSSLLDRTAKKMEDHLKDAQKIQRDLTSRQARTPRQ